MRLGNCNVNIYYVAKGNCIVLSALYVMLNMSCLLVKQPQDWCEHPASLMT